MGYSLFQAAAIAVFEVVVYVVVVLYLVFVEVVLGGIYFLIGVLGVLVMEVQQKNSTSCEQKERTGRKEPCVNARTYLDC